MTTTRQIVQGLEKGLDVLAALNERGAITAAEAARAAGLPRTTTLRLLDTLLLNGFIERGAVDNRYRLTIKVRTLSDGFDDEAWLIDIAAPHLRALTRAIVWPTLIALPMGTEMVWRENTDHATTMVLNRHSAGTQAAMLGSASGRVYLAYCREQERGSVVDLLRQNETVHRELLPDVAMAGMVAGIRADGYALFKRPNETTLAVPVLLGERYLASLAVRVISRAMSDGEVIARYLPPLGATAAAIGSEVTASIAPEG